MLESFFTDVLNMSLETAMVSEIKTKKVNLIKPFNQSITNSELKITITFMTREIDSMSLIRPSWKFLVAAPIYDYNSIFMQEKKEKKHVL